MNPIRKIEKKKITKLQIRGLLHWKMLDGTLTIP
jgi:hypothetical protein